MNEGFWFLVVERAVSLQKKLHRLEAATDTIEGGNEFSDFLCEVATTTTKLEGLNSLGISIERFVFPLFELTREKARMGREFAGGSEDSVNNEQLS